MSAVKRVIAFAMHETEQDVINSELKNAFATEAYSMGDADDDTIARMRAQNIIVQETDMPPLGRGASALSLTDRAKVNFETEGYYLMQIDGPLLPEWRETLESRGIAVLEKHPKRRYLFKLSQSDVAFIENLDFVKSVEPYRTQVPTETSGATGPEVQPSFRIKTYDVLLQPSADAGIVTDWLAGRQALVTGKSGRKVRFVALASSTLHEELKEIPCVQGVEEWIRPELFNDVSRDILGVQGLLKVNPGSPYEGEGQVVAVADTGIDEGHGDFGTRIIGTAALGRPGDASDPDGHGTHVAGSIAGDGSRSGGKVKGMAPKATIYFQSLLDSEGELGGLPFELGTLFQDAYDKEARIHNNSWGAATSSRYTYSSLEVDDFVYQHNDMLILFAAGNSGISTGAGPAAEGYVDWKSLGAPATAKNALTVGASRSSRDDGATAGERYGDWWVGRFGKSPIADDLISGDHQCLAAFSSRGPCDDYRIKPDVVAPGTDILSTRSSIAPRENYWGVYSSYYAYNGGTSMSTPIVSGCAALVREYFVSNGFPNPSAALLKAAIINGTVWLTGWDSTAAPQAFPNYHQGFGRVNMPTTIPNLGHPTMNLFAVDSKDMANGALGLGQKRRFKVSVGSGETLRICMAYTDPAARSIQNDLNLVVEKPDGSKIVGNSQMPMSIGNMDNVNNVEIVRIENPQPGEYWIVVLAYNLLTSSQDFALVVTGEVTNWQSM